MDFDFSEQQYMLRDAVRDLLRRECTPTHVREMWGDPTGRSPARWHKLADQGVIGLTVPEDHGGSGMTEVDLVLVLEEAGRALLPEPLLETTALGAPLLARSGTEAQRREWLPKVASGEAVVTVGLADQPYVADAQSADLVILERDGELHALTQDLIIATPQRSVDGARRLSTVVAETSEETRMGSAAAHSRWAFDRAAAATAAELIGVGQAVLERTLEYVGQREQFGRKVGAFQAVQHRLAETLLELEHARSTVYYAAYALAGDLPDQSAAASVAKAYAGEAERRANHVALQLHGGVGFTWEHDLHLWLKRGAALERAYGDSDWHRRRIADWIYATAG